jgi:hypothetical protein
MKTTNYKISKQLVKAGFKAENDFYWVKWNEGEPELMHEKEQVPQLIEKVPAYDLQTILEALPKAIEKRGVYELELYRDGNKWRIAYVDFEGAILDERLTQGENESLADTAARLLILLHEKGLINFNYVQDQKESILKERQRKNKAF